MNIDLTIVLSAFVAALPATIAAIAALIQAVRTHKEVNSRMTQMLEMNKVEAAATAVVGEKQKQEVRKDAAAKLSDRREP